MNLQLAGNQAKHGQFVKKLRTAKKGRCRAVISNRHTELMWVAFGKRRCLPSHNLAEGAAQ